MPLIGAMGPTGAKCRVSLSPAGCSGRSQENPAKGKFSLRVPGNFKGPKDSSLSVLLLSTHLRISYRRNFKGPKDSSLRDPTTELTPPHLVSKTRHRGRGNLERQPTTTTINHHQPPMVSFSSLVACAGLLFVAADSETEVLIEDFSDPLHVWRTFGDPHMGGVSDGSFRWVCLLA